MPSLLLTGRGQILGAAASQALGAQRCPVTTHKTLGQISDIFIDPQLGGACPYV